MRRRTFLITTATAGAAAVGLPVMSTYAPNWFKKHPMKPPAPDAIPSAFAVETAWPPGETQVRITAARDRYLCGGTTTSQARKTFTSGWCPVIVDVSTLTTRAVLPNPDDPAGPDNPNGTWTTKETELVEHSDEDDPKTALTTIVIGPALLDAEHAYLTLGTIALSSPDPKAALTSDSGPDIPDGATCPAVMLKIRLSDGTITASATLSEQVNAKQVANMHLSFTTDRASLLLAGGNTTPQRGNTDAGYMSNAEADYIGLRLSADDLSIQSDAHSVLDNTRITSISPCGQAIVVYADSTNRIILFLADGSQELINFTALTARDGWYYYKHGEYSRYTTHYYARNLTSGETIELNNVGTEEENASTDTTALDTWPDITSDQQEIVTLNRKALSVRLPGTPSPAFFLK